MTLLLKDDKSVADNLTLYKSDLISPAARSRQRRWGIYYTPKNLSDAIASWAIRTKHDSVLEPSFGGCEFLRAARRRFRMLAVRYPLSRLYGCDIDSNAFRYLAELFPGTPIVGHFLKTDFLRTTAMDFAQRGFTCVIGNPPFVRHHTIRKSTKKKARSLATVDIQLKLKRTSGLWAHFLAHALAFLNVNGRLAFVLPSSFVFADYAIELRQSVLRHFRHCRILRLNYHAFGNEGAEEKPIVLLADGFCPAVAVPDCRIAIADSEDQAMALVRSSPRADWGRAIDVGSSRIWHSPSSLPREFINLCARSECQSFGHLVSIEIGIVTGANEYFVLADETVKKRSLGLRSLVALISRAKQVPGISYRLSEHTAAIRKGFRCWLFAPRGRGPKGSSTRRYLSRIPLKMRRSRAWLKKRKKWFSPDIGKFPHAVFTYMNHWSPRLILTTRGISCTNTFHRVRFKRRVPKVTQQLIAVSLLTSFSQLSAELVGRTYGGGILKLEPSEARKIRVLVPDALSNKQIRHAYAQVDGALRRGDQKSATDVADALILGRVMGVTYLKRREPLLKALRAARNMRHRH